MDLHDLYIEIGEYIFNDLNIECDIEEDIKDIMKFVKIHTGIVCFSNTENYILNDPDKLKIVIKNLRLENERLAINFLKDRDLIFSCFSKKIWYLKTNKILFNRYFHDADNETIFLGNSLLIVMGILLKKYGGDVNPFIDIEKLEIVNYILKFYHEKGFNTVSGILVMQGYVSSYFTIFTDRDTAICPTVDIKIIPSPYIIDNILAKTYIVLSTIFDNLIIFLAVFYGLAFTVTPLDAPDMPKYLILFVLHVIYILIKPRFATVSEFLQSFFAPIIWVGKKFLKRSS